MNYAYLIMDLCWLISLFHLQCESCCGNIIQPQNYNTISVRIKYITKGPSFTYYKPDSECIANQNKALYYVDDICEISCEQVYEETSKKYTLSWTQQAENASICYPTFMAKKITIKIKLDRFDNGTVLRCAAFEDGGLKKSISNISFKFVNSQIESSNITYPPLEINPECSNLAQEKRYAIIDEKLYDSLTFPKDTTKVCIHQDVNATDGDDIFIKRRVTYMNEPKQIILLKPTAETKAPEREQFSKKSPEIGHYKLWMAIGGSVAGLTIFLIVKVIWKKKRKSSPDMASDPIYATAEDMNRVVYAELDMAEGSTFSPNREEVTPYAQVVGVLKMKNRT